MVKKVRKYMTKDVISFTEDTKLLEAVKKLSENHISGAPVVDKNKKVIGIITSTDITKALDISLPTISLPSPTSLGLIHGILTTRKKMKDFTKHLNVSRANKVQNVMMRNVVTVSPNDSIYTAATVLNKHKINRAPVVENDKLKGIISRNDLIKCLID